MTAVMWINGNIAAVGDAVVAASDHGFTVGDGVFETLPVVGGDPLALTRHLQRLQYSLDRIGLAPVNLEYVREGVAEAIAAGGELVGRLRVTVTSGPGPFGTTRGDGEPTVVIWAGPGVAPSTCRAVRAPWRRNERSALTGVKSTSHGENVVMGAFAAAQSADEAILANTLGHLCEGTSTNIFVERLGEIVTPPLSSGCLAGIARGLALEWGARAGLRIRVAAPGELTLSVLDEVVDGRAFMAVSSSVRGVQHVSWLDGAAVKEGQALSRLVEVYRTRIAVDPDPAAPRVRAGM